MFASADWSTCNWDTSDSEDGKIKVTPAAVIGEGDYSDTAGQIRNVRKHMFSEEKKLYFHGFDESRSVFWADPETGCSKGFWLRAIGWFAVALADLLEILPAGGDRDSLAEIFRELMEGVRQYADPETGLYWQVVDQGGGAKPRRC